MLLKEIIRFLESKAPPALAENYDNCGLITGHAEMEIRGVMICLDSTPEVIQDAKSKGCNLVVAHHPIVFSGLKKINGKNYVERTIIEAIRNDIAIYAIHTNLDNVHHGVNARIAERLGLQNIRILDSKKQQLRKLTVFVPVSHAEILRQALFGAGAGEVGAYDQCSFNVEGQGTFRAGPGTSPYVGERGIRHLESETRVEVLLPAWKTDHVLAAMYSAHPYEEVAYDVVALENAWKEVGSGIVGQLKSPMDTMDFLRHLKDVMRCGAIRHTTSVGKEVSRIAVCGGSGSFLLAHAIKEKADVLVTADFKYHQFFDADGRIVIADIGHYESEQFTMNLLYDWFSQKFPNFATHLTEVVTNPVHYL